MWRGAPAVMVPPAPAGVSIAGRLLPLPPLPPPPPLPIGFGAAGAGGGAVAGSGTGPLPAIPLPGTVAAAGRVQRGKLTVATAAKRRGKSAKTATAALAAAVAPAAVVQGELIGWRIWQLMDENGVSHESMCHHCMWAETMPCCVHCGICAMQE